MLKIFQKLLEINVKFKLQTCSACQDLLTMQFWSKFHYLFWSYYPFFIDLLQNCMVGRSWHAENVCSLNLTFISNSCPLFQKLLEINVKFKLQTFSACQDLPTMQLTPKWVTGFTSKLHGKQILTCWTCLQFKLNIYL
jgi:hypothetical protein